MSEGGHTRGQFLGAGAALSGAALAGSWRRPEAALAQEASGEAVTAKSGGEAEGAFGPEFFGERFVLEIDGASAGFVSDVRGGFPYGEVVVNDVSDTATKKHISNVKYSDLSFKFSLAQPGGMFEWIKATLDRSGPRRTGSIKACDADFRVLHEGFFADALITEIEFPAMDAVAKEPAYVTVKLTGDTRTERSTGTVPSSGVKSTAADFKFAVGQFSSKPVVKYSAFTIKQTVAPKAGGIKEPTTIEIPNIKVTLAQTTGLSSWLAWHEDFLIQGNFSEADEVSGSLTYTNSKGTKTLGALDFSHMGLVSMAPVVENVEGQSVRRVKAEMYCEDIRFTVAGS